eukprot:CAMPEP_0182823528 /NCGR_PEP_ID=MMETSP0006_2-20121128/14801_1 /TAXON_ID=97485 /ORGANISM="Prymnesium parvum, Strain Texoma1" /LENGTH=108 /DNA_ID=CAMNT_0024950457 /DNA_START=633 /DNA_END=954 /DNA_ORIENTATION=-
MRGSRGARGEERKGAALSRPSSSRGASHSSTAAFDLLAAAAAPGSGAAFLALLPPALFQPSSSAAPRPRDSLAWISAALPGRSKAHISHSHSDELLRKVHRGHSHSFS